MSGSDYSQGASKWMFWATALVVGSTGGAEAMGQVAPIGTADTWKDVRREMAQETMPGDMSAGVKEVLGRLDTGTDALLVARLSYAIVQPQDIQALDRFWTRYMLERGEKTGLTTVMEIRAMALGSAKVTRKNYLESWLYLARNGGNYDHCGGGNCSNGVGNGGGNGNGNEGGGRGRG